MSRDLRRYAQQTNVQLVIGFLLLLFIIGDGLIYVVYGPAAAITGLICMLAGLAPLVLIAVFLFGLDWIVKRADNE